MCVYVHVYIIYIFYMLRIGNLYIDTYIYTPHKYLLKRWKIEKHEEFTKRKH